MIASILWWCSSDGELGGEGRSVLTSRLTRSIDSHQGWVLLSSGTPVKNFLLFVTKLPPRYRTGALSQNQLEKPKYIWEEDILEFGVRSRI